MVVVVVVGFRGVLILPFDGATDSLKRDQLVI